MLSFKYAYVCVAKMFCVVSFGKRANDSLLVISQLYIGMRELNLHVFLNEVFIYHSLIKNHVTRLSLVKVLITEASEFRTQNSKLSAIYLYFLFAPSNVGFY